MPFRRRASALAMSPAPAPSDDHSPFKADSPFVRFLPAPSPAARRQSLTPKKITGASRLELEDDENIGQQLAAAAPGASKKGVASKRTGKQYGSAVQLKGSKGKMTKEMRAALLELEARGELTDADAALLYPELEEEEPEAEAWNADKELERTKALADKVKKPPLPKNVFIGAGLPATARAPKALAAPDWEALPSGTRLRVLWAGNDEYFECTIKDWHVAVGVDGKLFYTHRCEYEGGTFDHDLSQQTFEVIEVAQQAAARTPRGGVLPLTPREGSLKKTALNGSTPSSLYNNNYMPLSPRRKWLAQQEKELRHFSEELEQADIGTPLEVHTGEKQNHRARLALRRIRQPGMETPRTPRGNENEDGSAVEMVDPSDITYRLGAIGGATPAAGVTPARTPGFTPARMLTSPASRVTFKV